MKTLERVLQNIAHHIAVWVIDLFVFLVPVPKDMEEFPMPANETPIEAADLELVERMLPIQTKTLFEHDPNEPSGERITETNE